MFKEFLSLQSTSAKKTLSIVLCVSLLWVQALTTHASIGATGSQLQTWYVYDKGLYKAGVNTIDQTLTQSIGDLVDYTYYIGTDGSRVILTDYDYESYMDSAGKTRNRITSITDCTTGKHIDYGEIIGADGVKVYGWGALVERDRTGRMIGAYNYDEKGKLTSKDIFGMTAEEEAGYQQDMTVILAQIEALSGTNSALFAQLNLLKGQMSTIQNGIAGLANLLSWLQSSLLTADENTLNTITVEVTQLNNRLTMLNNDCVAIAGGGSLFSGTLAAGFTRTGNNNLTSTQLYNRAAAMCQIIGFPWNWGSMSTQAQQVYYQNFGQNTFSSGLMSTLYEGLLNPDSSEYKIALMNYLQSPDTAALIERAIDSMGAGVAAAMGIDLSQLNLFDTRSQQFSSNCKFLAKVLWQYKNSVQSREVVRRSGAVVSISGGLFGECWNQLQSLLSRKMALENKLQQNNSLNSIMNLIRPLITTVNAKLSQVTTDDTVKTIDLENRAVQKLPHSLRDKISRKNELLTQGDTGADQIEFSPEEVQLIVAAMTEVMQEMDSLNQESSSLQNQMQDTTQSLSSRAKLIALLQERVGRLKTATIYYKTVEKNDTTEQVMDRQVNFYTFMKESAAMDAKPVWVSEGADGRVSKVWDYGTDGKIKSVTEYKKDYVQVEGKVDVTVDDGCGITHQEKRDGVKNVLMEYAETTNYSEDEKPVNITRDGQVVGTFTYDNFGRLKESVYNDASGMKTTTVFDPALGRAKQSITEGESRSMQAMSWFEDEYGKKITGEMMITVNVRTVTDYNYNDTASDLTLKADDKEYKVSGGGLISTQSVTQTIGTFTAKTGEWYFKMDLTNYIDTVTTETTYMKDGEKFFTQTKIDNRSTTESEQTLPTKIWWTVLEANIGVALLVASLAITVASGGAGLTVGIGAAVGVVSLAVNTISSWFEKAKVNTLDNPPTPPVADVVSNGGYADISLRPPTEPPKAPISAGPMVNPANTGWGLR